ncbi:lipopolysaccharide biosynthesis protein [Coprobacter fastidiosus]|uniref:lipopolysaccharide biosynthesis protein n=1 Tax=Coprobacter fastidiosus TaxID=1099853 RepID=UPI003AB4B6E3
MSVSEAIESAPSLVRNFTFKTWEWILGDKNGNYQDAKKIIDLIQEYDEELAKDILEQTDKDPARIQYKYKQKLKRHIDKKKKIGVAQKDIKQVASLTNVEQQMFFEEKMENLIRGKSITKDILSTFSIMQIIFDNSISDTKYKKLVFVSLFITISGVIIGILGVVYSKYKYEFRVSSPIFVTTFIGIILYLNTYKQADYKFTTKYWKYALVLSIPLLPHYLSIKILNQVDRVMITQMVGLSETGLYNLACTVSNLMIIATDAINRSMCPYVYKSIKNKNILPVRKMTSSILLVVMVVSFLEMLIAPELIKIFATDDYLDAIYVIPPVAMSIYFIFLYVVFANVEFYFEKTIFATIVSGIAAVMNIGMNYIFLKKYGYYAAGYTTLICYMLFALLHYWNYKRILKREPYLNGIFDIRHVLLISFSGLALMGICLLLYRYSVIRFSLVIIIITISFYFRNQLKSIIKTSNN